MNAKECKTAVIGAGLAGCTAALELDKKGVEVEVFEALKSGEYTRKPQLTGTAHVLSTVPKIIKPKYQMNNFTFESENNTSHFEGNKIGNIYEVCSSNGAEQMLRDELQDRGIKVNYGSPIKSRDQLKGYSHVVIADGYTSTLAKLYGMRDDKPYLTSYGLQSITRGDFEPSSAKIILNHTVAPGAYIFHIPWDEEKATTVAFAMQSQPLDIKLTREKFRKYLEKMGWSVEDEWVEYEHFYRHPRYQRDNVYLVGAAGSFTCEFMGFGLYYTIESGIACAQSIATGEKYEDVLWRNVLSHLNVYRKMAPLMRNAGPKTHDYMVKVMGNFLAKYLVENGKHVFKIIDPLYPFVMAGGKMVSGLHALFLKGK